MGWYNRREFSSLIGKTLSDVSKVGDDVIIFTTDSGERYKMYHEQDCCEGVYIEDIEGDLKSLVGTPILAAEEVSNYDPGAKNDDDKYGTYTWTFYKIATIQGHVDIRWYGSSNGYYSESVDFEIMEND